MSKPFYVVLSIGVRAPSREIAEEYAEYVRSKLDLVTDVYNLVIAFDGNTVEKFDSNVVDIEEQNDDG